MSKVVPNLIIMVVYRSDNGAWRGFCSPYNVTCEAETKEKAIQNLKDSVDIYERGLEKYEYPKHLSVKKLSNQEDKEVFRQVVKFIAKDIQKRIENEYFKYQSSKRKSFSMDKFSGYYRSAPAFL